MRTKLITALRTAATALEQGLFEYEWSQPQTCNCGIVACSIMGKSASQMREMLYPLRQGLKSPTWQNLIARHCPVTGIPENVIFRELMEAGMSTRDMAELEALANRDVLIKMGLKKYPSDTPPAKKLSWYEKSVLKKEEEKPKPYYTQKEWAVKYMRAWADLLVEQGSLDTVPTEKQNEPAQH